MTETAVVCVRFEFLISIPFLNLFRISHFGFRVFMHGYTRETSDESTCPQKMQY
jgi:hypothetical protein